MGATLVLALEIVGLAVLVAVGLGIYLGAEEYRRARRVCLDRVPDEPEYVVCDEEDDENEGYPYE